MIIIHVSHDKSKQRTCTCKWQVYSLFFLSVCLCLSVCLSVCLSFFLSFGGKGGCLFVCFSFVKLHLTENFFCNKFDWLTSGTDSSSQYFSSQSLISFTSFSWKPSVSASAAAAYLQNNDRQVQGQWERRLLKGGAYCKCWLSNLEGGRQWVIGAMAKWQNGEIKLQNLSCETGPSWSRNAS